MFILELNQNSDSTELAIFNTIEEGREFLEKTNCYETKEEDGIFYEYLNVENLQEYTEILHNGNVIPLTKYMFTEVGKAEIFWKELPNLSQEGNGMVENSTRVDAYMIPNSELKNYIVSREKAYNEVKKHLEEKNYKVTRSFFGSEDGEAIMYKKKEKDEWHFLTHLDPSLFENKTTEEIIDDIDRELN